MLIFLCVGLIAVVFIKVFGAAAPGGDRRWALTADAVPGARAQVWVVVDTLVLVYALLPVLWILSLSLKPTLNGQGRPADSVVGDVGQLPRHLPRRFLQLGADQLDRHRR